MLMSVEAHDNVGAESENVRKNVKLLYSAVLFCVLPPFARLLEAMCFKSFFLQKLEYDKYCLTHDVTFLTKLVICLPMLSSILSRSNCMNAKHKLRVSSVLFDILYNVVILQE